MELRFGAVGQTIYPHGNSLQLASQCGHVAQLQSDLKRSHSLAIISMRLSPIFHDHAVLQRDQPLPIWGTAVPGSAIEVRLGNAHARVTSATDGRWLLRLPAQSAGGPYELTATGEGKTLAVCDVLIGDVWICSGQSNAEWTLEQVNPGGEQAADGEFPNVRLLTVNSHVRIGRQIEVQGRWTPCTSSKLMPFSAMGGWFGRILHRELGIPIGIIANARGSTRIQSWISREALMTDPAGREELAACDVATFLTEITIKEIYSSLDEWAQAEGPIDTGNFGLTAGWAGAEFDDSDWETMDLPSHWQLQGHPGCGILWFRCTVEVPAAWVGSDLTLSLGAIDKHDDTYVNGERVGGVSWEDSASWTTMRNYTLPAKLVGPERRVVIAVRARSHANDGGLTGPGEVMKLHPCGDDVQALPLSGSWTWKVEQDWGKVTPPGCSGFGPGNINSPHSMYDTRLHPLIPYGIRGVIWYQGESNAHEAGLYRRLLPLMITDWRRVWGQGEFPFIQVQLANYREPEPDPGESDWAALRSAQTSALRLPNVGMAVAIDVGDADDIHPKDKKSVGQRLARWALSEVYHRGLVPNGPLLRSSTPEIGGCLRLSFHQAHGLTTRDGGPVRHLAIADSKRIWRWAESRIEGENLLVWHPDIPHPAAARYAWADNPAGCNLINSDDLPAAPFDTDSVNGKE